MQKENTIQFPKTTQSLSQESPEDITPTPQGTAIQFPQQSQAPQIDLPAPVVAEQPPAEAAPVTVSKQAEVIVTRRDKSSATFPCGRNFTVLKAFVADLGNARADVPSEIVDIIEINLMFSDGTKKQLFKGSYADTVTFFKAETLTPATAIEMLKFLCTRFVECSEMNHALFMLQFNEGVAALGIHNDTLPITQEDTEQFIVAMLTQAFTYVNTMQQKYPDSDLHGIATTEAIKYLSVALSNKEVKQIPNNPTLVTYRNQITELVNT